MFARALLARPFSRVAVRQFSLTARRRYASPDLSNLANLMQSDPKLRDIVEKLSRHPPAIVAMQKLGDIVQKKGLHPAKSAQTQP